MEKTVKFICTVVCLVLVVSCCLAACNKQDDYKWQIAEGVTAQFTDNGHYGFILTVSGNGAIPDYNTAKDAPWYSKSGRVTEIVIEEGITAIGNNAFTKCGVVELVVVPTTVVNIGKDCFSSETAVCVYHETETQDDTVLYMYSENYKSGNYWGMKNGIPTLWKELKVLFIGNSFTLNHNIPDLFEQIATSLNQVVEVIQVTKGSWTLTKFADPTDEYGAQVEKLLNENSDFDIIVLQEQSTRPIDNYNGFYSAVETLKQKIDSTQDNCTIYLYSTWGYQSVADSAGKTIPEIELQIRTAYKSVADAFDLPVCQVGKAFTAVYESHKDINTYDTDNKHQSEAGAFLSACVHVATLLNCDPRQSDFCGTLSEETAATLRQVAYEVVFGQTL